jgi:ribosomal protein S12 methylthiotransferase
VQFDRVGAFTYSAQEGTAANAMRDDVPDPVKLERLERLTELQRLITAERFDAREGGAVRAIVDRVADSGIEARTIWQAPEIDGTTRVERDVGSERLAVRPGDIVELVVDAVTEEGDLEASMTAVASRAPLTPSRSRQRVQLPLATVGSYGR